MKNIPDAVQDVDNELQLKRIYCIASGESEGVLKLYMYSKSAATQTVFYIEVQIVRATKVLQANIKTQNKADGEKFKKAFEAIIKKEF